MLGYSASFLPTVIMYRENITDDNTLSKNISRVPAILRHGLYIIANNLLTFGIYLFVIERLGFKTYIAYAES